MSERVRKSMQESTVPAHSLAATKSVLAVRERELLELKGPCSDCRLHRAHAGPCAPATTSTRPEDAPRSDVDGSDVDSCAGDGERA